MIDPRKDLQLALTDDHRARIDGVDHYCVHSAPGVDDVGVQTSSVYLSLIGYYDATTGNGRIQGADGIERTIEPDDQITSIELYPGETRGPYTVEVVEPTVGGLVRLRCRTV